MADKYLFSDEVSAPSRNQYEITPSDSTPLSIVPKAIYVGTGGSIKVKGLNSTSNATFLNVPDGSILPIRVLYVYATGTDASGIIALA